MTPPDTPAPTVTTDASPSVTPSQLTFATWVGFAAMGTGMFMAILDIQVVVTSLPAIQAALGIAPDQMSWVQTAYLIAEVIAIPLTGLLTRVLTMRGLFVIALAIFTIASVGCASSGGFAALIAWRTLQGFAGGVLIPLVFSAVFLLFPYARQGIATTIAGVLAVLAPTVGPLVGGWITQTYSWHWLFLINVAPAVLAIAIAVRTLPFDTPRLAAARHIDWVSLLLMAVALAALVISLKEAPKRGWMSGAVVGLLLLFLTSAAVFIRRTLSAPQPIVDLRALKDRDFAVGCWLSFTLGAGLYGTVYLMPVFLAFVRQHDSLEIGQIMLVTGAVQLLSAPIAVQLERRIDARLLTACGFVLFAAGLASSAFQSRLSDFDDLFWPQVVRGIAMMLCLLPPTRLALGHIATARVADASGLFNLMRNLGGAIGLALLDTIIFGRASVHGKDIVEGLQNLDVELMHRIGVPQSLIDGAPDSLVDPKAEAVLRPLVEHQSLTLAIGEAWTALAVFVLLGVAALPLARRSRPAANG